MLAPFGLRVKASYTKVVIFYVVVERVGVIWTWGQADMLVDASRKQQNFPGGPVVKNPLSYAGDTGSIPGLKTGMQYAEGQLSPRATTASPRAPKPARHN